MYGKIFESIYGSSVADDWEVMVTFQQFIVLGDRDGIVDMTLSALMRRTNIPEDILRHGISQLEKPHPDSRSGAHEGRRIVRLDPEREWGWQIVNYAEYRDLATADDKRAKGRLRKRQQRQREANGKDDVTHPSRPVPPGHASSRLSRHIDIDVDADKNENIEGEKDATRKRPTSLPKDFCFSKEMEEWANREVAGINLHCETKKFAAHYTANGKTFVDWPSAWKKWMLKAQDFTGKRESEPESGISLKQKLDELADKHQVPRQHDGESLDEYQRRISHVDVASHYDRLQ